MACCELCSGWFHFECLKVKEGAGMMEGKEFVCCFCLSSQVLTFRD